MLGIVIAIDGPSASGKGTLARKLATQLGLKYLNTGSLYRAAAFYAIKHKIAETEVAALEMMIKAADFSHIDQLDLYNSEIGNMSSKIAAIPEVRRALFELQRNFPTNINGAVIEGRDIGTVIFPDAQIKFYITADINVRASRRFKQLQSTGENIIYDSVLRDLQERDFRDETRLEAPSKRAADSFIVDTSGLDPDSVLSIMLTKVREAIPYLS